MKHLLPGPGLWCLLACVAALLLTGASARAQQPTPLPAASPDSLRRLENRPPPLKPVVTPTDTLVRITPCPAAGGRVRVGSILFAGNHRTVARVLQAELNFHEGDSLTLAELPKLLETNRQRIYNLQLFHAVLVQASCGGTGQLTVLFSVQERWYVLPTPILSLAEQNGDFNRWRERPDRWQRIDYGLHLVDTNFRGHAEQLTANVQFGFNRKFELFYEVPGFGPRRRVGLGFAASYYQARNIDYDVRGDTTLSLPLPQENDFAVQRFYLSGGLRLRHTVQRTSAIDMAFHREQVSREIFELNPTYYGGQPERRYLDASFITTKNERNTFAYPLTGRFLQGVVAVRQFFGADRTPAYLTLAVRGSQYLSLGHQFYYAIGANLQAKLFASRLAEVDARALGYDTQLRGYNRYVAEGRGFAVVQQGLSWRAWAPPPLRIPLVNNPKINTLPLAVYLNVFADAGVVAGAPVPRPMPVGSRLPNTLLASAGAGLHLVTYYDRVFRWEVVRVLSGYPQFVYLFSTGFPI